MRYDFAVPGAGGLRTFTTTRFFNILPGKISPEIFRSPC